MITVSVSNLVSIKLSGLHLLTPCQQTQSAISTSTSETNIVSYGSSTYSGSANLVQVNSTGSYKVNITTPPTYYILQYTWQSQTNEGFGVASVNGKPEVYTTVKITNLAGVNVDAAGDVITNNYSGVAAWVAVAADSTVKG